MPNINIKIRNKVAKGEYAVIVCDNSDYTAVFDFDAEWDEYTRKTARFVYGGKYTDVVFSGNECAVPVIQDTRAVTVGVYAGDLHTTTPAYFACVPSILFGNGIPADPTPEVYAQIMELLGKISDEGVAKAVTDALEQAKVSGEFDGEKGNDGISPAVSVAAITGGNRVTITDAEGAKTFDVMDGAQGASGADGKDYVLTNADKQEIAKAAAGLVDVPSVQPDWNQNDSTQPDYVKNRPFYTGNPVETVLVGESTVSFADQGGVYSATFPSTFSATVGETYKVYWDGTAYECTCVDFNGHTVIGNPSVAGVGSDTGEPFMMVVVNGNGIQIYAADTSASHTFSISGFVQEVVKIDAKYLPSENVPYTVPIVINEDIRNAGNEEKKAIYDAFRSGNLILIRYRGAYSGDEYAILTYVYFEESSSKTLFKFTYLAGEYLYYYDSQVDPSIRGTQISDTGIKKIVDFRVKYILRNDPLNYFVLNSSTAGSTKKFRITVDDSGTITATEVT